MKSFVLCLIFVALFPAAAFAATYQVGPTRAFTKLQDVAPLLAPGDLVEVDGDATYPGDLIFTRPGTAAADAGSARTTPRVSAPKAKEWAPAA